ncbi:MAG: UDP-N-acetylmuramate--L-alanine ligase [Micromonosporaceae bacterium]
MSEPELTAEDLGRVHLIGVGGVGMSALARLLLTRGIPTSGSELHDWPSLPELAGLGGVIYREHVPGNLDGVDTVVYSTAIPQDHLEMVEARRRGVRVLHRSEALAAAMCQRTAIVVAGTHGKTTTSSMITLVLQRCGWDPSYVIGGEITGHPGRAASNAHHGAGEHFVAEADEADRSFLRYRPDIGIVTNIDADHLNTYGDMAGLHQAFLEFAQRIRPGGFLVACADDPGARKLIDQARQAQITTLTYGESQDADLRLSKVSSSAAGVRYHAALDGVELGEFTVPSPGRHLGLNSAAAVLTAVKLGLPAEQVAQALSGFPGVRRRFELKGVVDQVRVYDEYAYHPTSMLLAMQTLREVAGAGRLIVVFQPYRVYRTRDLEAEIAEALGLADLAVVMEVFGPGETRAEGEGGASLTRALPLPEGQKLFVPEWSDVVRHVSARARPGDVVVTMGAPPISLMGDELLAALAARPGASRPDADAGEADQLPGDSRS